MKKEKSFIKNVFKLFAASLLLFSTFASAAAYITDVSDTGGVSGNHKVVRVDFAGNTKYYLYLQKRNSGSSTWGSLASNSNYVASGYFTHALPSDQTYYFRLRACDRGTTGGAVNCSYSSEQSITLTSNSPPSISPVSDITINEDGSAVFQITVSDADTPLTSVNTFVTQSGTITLSQSYSWTITGTGSSRTVTITPAANDYGVAPLRIIAVDNTGRTDDEIFTLTVNSVNDAPTISNIPNISINEDSNTGYYEFSVNDVETSNGSLTVTATSNNAALVPNGNISVIAGTDVNKRKIRVTPVANAYGSATITVTVNDGAGGTGTDIYVVTVNSVNDAPTISNIANTAINEDSNTGNIAFTVNDIDTSVSQLTVSGTSSNSALVPNGNITFGGSGSSRTVRVTPLANQFGSATITVTVSDGAGGTASDTFVVTVSAVNDAPTISNIANKTINEDSDTGNITFTVNDVDTSLSQLTVSGTSSNSALVPNGNITFGGSGSSRTVRVIPVANQSGSATVTVTVSDGAGGTASDTFVVTVSAVNDVPTISNITNKTINEDSDTGNIAFTVNDIDTSVSLLTVSGTSSNSALVPNGNIIFGGSGSSRTVRVTPVANQSGSATIAVTVSDGAGGTTNDSFVVTVNSVNDVPVISNVGNQATNEDSSTSAINFTVSDVETSAGSLTVSASSNNIALVPNSAIVLSGSGGSRNVTLTPLANKNGSATITLTVSDGSASATDTFVLTVNSVNDAPTISNTANQTINEDTDTGSIEFTVGDIDTDVSTLTLAASSSNTPLVPHGNITFGGSGANRTVKVTPLANKTGTATITVTVSDGNTSATDTFLLTVNGVNDAPTISNISNKTINEDASTGNIGFVVSDVETNGGDLVVSATSSNTALVPNSAIVIGGTGSSKTINITPSPNQHGSSTITVTVSDGSLSNSDSFVLTVNGINDAPTISSIDDVVVQEDSPIVIPFTVTDDNTPLENLNIFTSGGGSTFNTYPTYSFSGSGTNRTLTIATAPNDTGTVDVVIVVQEPNGGLSVTSSFKYTVLNVEDAPTISNIGNISVRKNSSSGAINFTIGDPDTNASSLILSATSSNHSVVSPGGISFGGSGSNRTITVTTADIVSGSSTIEVKVSDGTTVVSDQFIVSIDQKPTISEIGDQQITVDEPSIVIPFEVYDAETPLSQLIVFRSGGGSTFTNALTYNFAGVATQRTLTIVPEENDSGSVDVVIVVQDSVGQTDWTSFKFTVVNEMGAQNISSPVAPVLGDPSVVSSFEKDTMDGIGDFSGQMHVESGAMLYSVPIRVVEGTAGVTPQLSLEYTSNGGNGPIGKGWSLGGIEAISRCRQTLLQDGAAKPITWSAEDRFCLNGQRLILTSGTYGSPNSEYKTEIDSFVKITAKGGSAGHPDYFEMEAKDGSLTVFGASGESNSERSAYQGNSKVANRILSWSKSRFEDSVGNAIVYGYSQREDYFFLSYIYYGAGANPGSGNYTGHVSFAYEFRDDVTAGWVGGYKFKNDRRLATIHVWNGGNRLRYYSLNYEHDAAYTAPNADSRISEIKECTDDDICLPPLKFEWGEREYFWSNVENVGFDLDSNKDLNTYTLLDINGDGKLDTAWVQQSGSSNAILRYKITGDTNDNSGGFFVWEGDELELFPIDLNADGRMDLLYYEDNSNTWSYALAVPHESQDLDWVLSSPTQLYGLPDLDNNTEVQFGDFDSDGLADAIFFNNNDVKVSVYHLRLTHTRLGHSSSFTFQHGSSVDQFDFDDPEYPTGLDWDPPAIVYRGSGGKKKLGLGDFNGDGRMDFAIVGSWIDIYTRSADGFDYFDSIFGGQNPNNNEDFLNKILNPDINGDGLTDIAFRHYNNWYYALSTGAGLTDHVQLTSVSDVGQNNLTDENIVFVDLDGDGLTEVVWRSDDMSASPFLSRPLLYKTWDTKTEAFSENRIFENATGAYVQSFSLADVNGSGMIDRIYFSAMPITGGYRTYMTVESSGNKLDAIEKITSGYGKDIEVKYEPLTTTDHYSTVKGISYSEETTEHCWVDTLYQTEHCSTYTRSVASAEDFYTSLQTPFEGMPDQFPNEAPVLEVRGPMYVVTDVSQKVPTVEAPGNVNEVSYFYETARLQFGGRGFLGFKKLANLNKQSMILSETTFRQDWPYIGMPLESTTRSPSGKLLSRSVNEYQVRDYGTLSSSTEFDNIATNGTAPLGALQIYADKSLTTNYDLQADGETQGDPLTTVVTLNEMDDFGNILSVTTATKIGGRSADADGELLSEADDFSVDTYFSKQFVENTYINTEEGEFLGRLITSKATTSRDPLSLPEGVSPSVTRDTAYSYYGMNGSVCSAAHGGNLDGLLCEEIIKVGGVPQLTTRHHYDQHGNETWTYAYGPNGETRLSGFVQYDTRGRYPIATYNVFNGALSSVSVSDPAYNTQAEALGMSVKLTSEVVSRNAYGIATHTQTWVDDTNYTTSRAYATSGGQVYFTTSSDGTAQQSLLSTDLTDCPAGSVYTSRSKSIAGAESKTCYDKLGRKRRELTIGFNGQWVGIDTEYDSQGRAYKTSEPFFMYSNNGNASDWTIVSYDLLNRPVSTILPFEETDEEGDVISGAYVTTVTTYDGFTTTLTTPGVGNSTDLVKTETRNPLGELVSITEIDENTVAGTATAYYYYDVQGNLVRLVDPTGENVTTLIYNVMGQKEQMSDPDKGTWYYSYSVFGDLRCQRDAEGNIIKHRYDGRGRLVERWDYTGGEDCENPTGLTGNAVWEFDVADNGLDQLSDEQDLVSGYGITYSYDTLGRMIQSTTTIPGTSPSDFSYHHSGQTFDEYGRVFQTFDAARFDANFNRGGVQNEYNQYGYLWRVRDAHNADNGGTIYYQINTMDQRGKVTNAYMANNVTQMTAGYDARTGFTKYLRTTTNGPTNVIQDMDLKWDHLGNLRSRADHGKNLDGSFRDFAETFSYDTQNRLVDFVVTNNTTNAVEAMYVHYTEDGTGNIKEKSDVGLYEYTGAGPHAVSKVGGDGGVSYYYDNNGSLDYDTSGRDFSYTAFDKVETIVKGDRRTDFSYGTQRARYKRVDTKTTASQSEVTTTLYIGGVEKIYFADGKVEWKSNIAGIGQITYTFDTDANEPFGLDYLDQKLVYFAKDHLGSINAIIDTSGQLLQEVMFFDPWGARREVTTYDAMQDIDITQNYFKDTKPITTRGFTGHEMVDEVGIIHMNGRIYDAKLGRFLQADPFVQAPDMIGSLNRYSYVMNNPLNAVDPSGYFFGDITKGLRRQFIRFAAKVFGEEFVNLVGTVISTYYGGAAGAALWNYDFSRAMGVPRGQAFRSAAITFVTASAFSAIGASNMGNTQRMFAHAMVGGVEAELRGGSFGQGFLTAGFTKGVDLAGGTNFGGASTRDILARTTVAAVIGGTVSVATGGKFANGARTAAMAHLLNQEVVNARNGTGPYAQKGPSTGAGTASQGRNPLSVAGNVLGKIWNIPNTILGLTFGGIGHIVGWMMGTNPYITFGNNAIQFHNNPLMPSAITLGNVIVYGPRTSPSDGNVHFQNTPSGHTVGQEEYRHTVQGQILGPLYLPAHIIGGLTSMLRSPNAGLLHPVDSWHSNNFMETGPMQDRVF